MERKLLRPSGFAKLIGVTPQYISKLIKMGIIPLHNGAIDVKEAMRLIEENSDPARAKGNQTLTYIEARAMKEYYRSQLLELEVKDRKKKLINKKQLDRELSKFFTFLKRRIRSIGLECAKQIADLDIRGKSQHEILAMIQEILKTEHDQALTILSQWNAPAMKRLKKD